MDNYVYLNLCAKANRVCHRWIEGLVLMPSFESSSSCLPLVCMLEYSTPFPYYAAHKLLEEALGKSTTEPAGKPSSINCIVTSGSLVPSIAKSLLYRLDDVISSDNGMPLSS